jgi:DNA-binding transcriptional LysR family regulator
MPRLESSTGYFDLVDLKLFAHIAETNSLTHGAERSFMSLPSASERVKKIEERLGTKLLYRNQQGVTLTPAGQVLLHHAQLVLRQLMHLRADLRGYVEGMKGLIRIFATTTAMYEFLPSALSSYLSVHPDLNVDLREHASDDIVRAIGEGMADVGIISGSASSVGLEVLPYRQDRLVLATPFGHELAEHESVSFSEIMKFDHIGWLEGSAMHAFLGRVTNSLHKLNIRVQVSNFEVLCNMVESNVGIGVLTETAARRRANFMKISVVPFNDDWAFRDFSICVRSLQLLPRFGRELVAFLVSEQNVRRSISQGNI